MTGAPAMPPIEFIDLARQQRRIRSGLDAAIARVLQHGRYIMGPEVAELEGQLSAFCGARHAITCASGTDALLLALMAKGLRPGDAVIVPSFTFCATAEPVCLLGGVPIFADVDEDSFNLDAGSLEAAIHRARHLGLPLRGIISVDLFGQPCDYDRIEAIARESSIWLICDAAQSFGASYRGRKVGTIGDITTTSFFPAKPLGCYGDGGAVFMQDDRAAAVIRSLRVHGKGKDKYDNVRVGMNGRLDTLQAAILLEKLAVFADEIEARNSVAKIYDELLPAELARPVIIDQALSVWAQYTVRTSRRQEWIGGLASRGVPTAVYYERPLHLQPAYRAYPTASDRLRTSELLAASVFSLPMHPYLAYEDQLRIIAAMERPAQLGGRSHGDAILARP
jgi:dTDP-4-amino-4,6-dideoxygalactose transaminase